MKQVLCHLCTSRERGEEAQVHMKTLIYRQNSTRWCKIVIKHIVDQYYICTTTIGMYCSSLPYSKAEFSVKLLELTTIEPPTYTPPPLPRTDFSKIAQ